MRKDITHALRALASSKKHAAVLTRRRKFAIQLVKRRERMRDRIRLAVASLAAAGALAGLIEF